MRRRLLLAVLLPAALLLGTPELLGRWLAAHAAAALAASGIVTERYERGWLSSRARLRLSVRDEHLARLAGWLGTGAVRTRPVVMIVEMRVDHGILPLGALFHDDGSLQPGLANGVATLRLQTVDGTRQLLPGRLRLHIGLRGAMRVQHALPADRRHVRGGRLSWRRAALDYRTSADGRRQGFGLTLDHASFADGRRRIAAERLRVTIEGTAAGAGDFDIALDGLSSAAHGAVLRDAAGARLAGHTALQRGRLEVRATLALHGLLAASTDSRVRLTLGGLDAVRLAAIRRGIGERLLGERPPGAAPAEIYRGFFGDLRALIGSGASLSRGTLEIRDPAGVTRGTLDAELPGGAPGRGWGPLLHALGCRATLQLPLAVVAARPQLRQDLQPAIAGGVLRADGDAYRMRASCGDGVLTINGAPLPLPAAP
ncbi:MAG TPA: DUF945 family protein [Woeseiaceae bacterium]|nr:DUF945 family protein [Woeseiaceae bacterium]